MVTNEKGWGRALECSKRAHEPEHSQWQGLQPDSRRCSAVILDFSLSS